MGERITKAKDRVKETALQVKEHVVEYKEAYIVGAVGAAGIAATYVVMRTRGVNVDSTVSVKQGIAVNSPVTITNITTVIDKALGDSGDVIRNTRTGEIVARSRGEFSRMTGFSMKAIGKYFKGELNDLGGEQYDIVDKAERLLSPLA